MKNFDMEAGLASSKLMQDWLRHSIGAYFRKFDDHIPELMIGALFAELYFGIRDLPNVDARRILVRGMIARLEEFK